MHRLLSIDPATHTGWALYDEEIDRTTWGLEDFSAWEMYGPRALRFSRWFTWMLTKQIKPTLISIEEPHPGRKNRISARHWLGWLYVELQRQAVALAEKEPVRMEIIQPADLKTFATGRGNASKDDVLDAIRASMPGRQAIWSKDIADALAQNDLMRYRHDIGEGYLVPYCDRVQPRLAV